MAREEVGDHPEGETTLRGHLRWGFHWGGGEKENLRGVLEK